MAETHETLVKKAIINKAKPNLFSASFSSRCLKAKSGKNKTQFQETPKKDSPFSSSRLPRRGPSSSSLTRNSFWKRSK